jgi:hypothetical protein
METKEKLAVAFALSLTGGIISLIGVIISIIFLINIMRHLFGTLVGIFSIIDNEIGSSSIWVYLILIPLSHIIMFSLPNLICAGIIIIGAIILYSSEKGRVLAGGMLVLVFSILSIFFLFMTGLLLLSFNLRLFLVILLGNVMSLVGGILALTWKPEKASEQQFTVMPPPP